jgi:lipoprotein-anchoring transpeptidase ErfK/SrfK
MGVPRRALAAIAALGGLAALTGCSAAAEAGWHGPAGNAVAGTSAPVASITAPAQGATGVPTAGEIALTAAEPAAARVVVTDASGAPVEGELRSDGSSWAPAKQLAYSTGYTATVTSPGGTSRVSFTTMDRPGYTVGAHTPLADDAVYGVAMPIVVSFDQPVPADRRAGIEQRLFVRSSPAQLGAWHWFGADEVHYRPREYWREGTKLQVRLAIGGLALGGDAYGESDVTIHASIGDKVVMSTDNATKMLTVTRHDQVVRTIPVSLGKPSKPSSSGAMVVMTKAQSELFVSTDPADPYRTTVYWTQRLTWGGEYLHAAPWSVDDQGQRNVSHGCTNMSDSNAEWLYGLTHIGDPVLVTGTGASLEWGNGWTDWYRPWEEYVKGSALPAPVAPASPPAAKAR